MNPEARIFRVYMGHAASKRVRVEYLAICSMFNI